MKKGELFQILEDDAVKVLHSKVKVKVKSLSGIRLFATHGL